MRADIPDISIRSSRLLIEPFRAQDAAESFQCITSSLARYMSWEAPRSSDEYENVWRGWLDTIADGSDFVFTLRRQTDARFIGLAGLHNIHGQTPELGIWIREDEHRCGYGYEAVDAVFQYASQNTTATCFIYPVAIENLPSRSIAEQLGGTVIETRSASKYDSVVYGIPRSTAP